MLLTKGVRYEKTVDLDDLQGLPEANQQAKADTDGGTIEGYLAIFGNVDRYGERIIKGAFAKSIKQRVAREKVPLMIRHFRDGGDFLQMVGVIVQAKEDNVGLWIKAEFLDDAESQAVRGKVMAARKKGMVVKFSVGYELIGWNESIEDGKRITNLTELILREGTITLRPVNDAALVTGAKSTDDPDVLDILKRLDTLAGKMESFLGGDKEAPVVPSVSREEISDRIATINRRMRILERK